MTLSESQEHRVQWSHTVGTYEPLAPRITREPGVRDDARLGSNAIRRIVESYDSAAIRAYSKVRFTILRQPFLEEIGQYLPARGDILDMGCGFGLFSLYFAMGEAGRRIVGVDLDENRVAAARRSAAKLYLRNVSYEVCDAVTWQSAQRFDAIYMLDLIHHLPKDHVETFLAAIAGRVKPGGTLLLKEVAPTPRFKMLFTLALDRLMVGSDPIRYWPPQELSAILTRLGFDIVRHRMTDFLPYPHLLYVCRKRRD
jgi:2-polyprenyl-3-methyl-5-hydroxy-6-metoxy-1,4-benzoquinol methylase